MGRKGDLGIVTPQEFKARTALTLSSRSGTTLLVDKAYENYYATRSPTAARMLYLRLGEYMVAHGGHWANCERDLVSGGLMSYFHRTLSPIAEMSPQEQLAMDQRAAARIRDIEIPHARFGVLYFLAGIKIEVDVANTAIKGLGVAGNAVAAGVVSDLRLSTQAKEGSKVVGQLYGKDVKSTDIVAAGTKTLKMLNGRRQNPLLPKSASSLACPLPATGWALQSMADNVEGAWSQGKIQGVLAAVGTVAFDLPIAATVLAVETVYRVVKAAIDNVCRIIIRYWDGRYNRATMGELGGMLRSAAKVVVEHIVKNAVPFVAAGMDIVAGLAGTIRDAGTRIAAWNDRRLIRLRAGHPEDLANAIEHQMSMGLVDGMLDILKGAAKAAATTFLPGLGSLASAVIAGIDWLFRVVWRLSECRAIEDFLDRARTIYGVEKRRATLKGGHYEPDLVSDGGIITDTKAFTAFFRDGCNASPLIPMLTLNSGLGGSLMTMLELFEADGSQSRRTTQNIMGGVTREFDRGAEYFTRLKSWSVQYMRSSGFRFLPLDPDDKQMKGYLVHATGVGKTTQSHAGSLSTLGQVGALVAGR